MPIAASEIVCKTLERLGVTTVFGLPGTHNVALFDALRRSSLRTIVATDELMAGFMGIGYYRASGKVGVVTVIPGPGFTYMLTALAEARHDSAALLLITMCDRHEVSRPYRFQVIDQSGMAGPVVKKTFVIEDVTKVVETLADAYLTTLAGEPGPVLVEISLQAMRSSVERLEPSALPVSTSASDPDSTKVAEVARILKASKRPVLYVGQGAADAGPQVKALAEALSCPVFCTSSGRGILPEDHTLSFAYDFAFGLGKTAAAVLSEADLILAIGCKFTHNGSAGFQLELPKEKLIHVDSSPEVAGASYPAKIAVVSDARKFLDRLWDLRSEFEAEAREWSATNLACLRAKLREEQRAAVGQKPNFSADGFRNCEEFFEVLRQALPRKACLVTDSGLHQMLTRSYYQVLAPRGLIVPADFQSMGFGIPAAIGARLALPDRSIVALVGDGAMAMTASELLTAVREKLNLTVILFNDGFFGLIRQQQIGQAGRTHGVDLQNPDFETLATALGVRYFAATGQIREELAGIIDSPGVKLVEVALTDSPEMRRSRAVSAVRSKAGQVLGPRLIGRLKQILKR